MYRSEVTGRHPSSSRRDDYGSLYTPLLDDEEPTLFGGLTERRVTVVSSRGPSPAQEFWPFVGSRRDHTQTSEIL